MDIKLYHHKTDGGAEYLTDTFIVCPNGHKEGCFRQDGDGKEAKYIIRIDGDIEEDAEMSVRED